MVKSSDYGEGQLLETNHRKQFKSYFTGKQVHGFSMADTQLKLLPGQAH